MPGSVLLHCYSNTMNEPFILRVRMRSENISQVPTLELFHSPKPDSQSLLRVQVSPHISSGFVPSAVELSRRDCFPPFPPMDRRLERLSDVVGSFILGNTRHLE